MFKNIVLISKYYLKILSYFTLTLLWKFKMHISVKNKQKFPVNKMSKLSSFPHQNITIKLYSLKILFIFFIFPVYSDQIKEQVVTKILKSL